MPSTTIKNLPSARVGTEQFYGAATYDCVLTVTSDVVLGYVTPAPHFRPLTALFSDHTKVTFEVTCSSDAAILAETALWKVITLTTDVLQFTTPINAFRITSTNGASTAAVCI